MRRLKVLFLTYADPTDIWRSDVIAAIGDRHDLVIFDPNQPLAPQFAGADVVLDHGGSVGNRAMMDAATDAHLWQILGTGFDHFDLAYIKTKGIPVANTPGQFSSVALAETAMMFILMLAHRYREGAKNFEKGVLYRPIGVELENRRIGIVGFGASGQDLAKRARAFGMQVLAIDVRPIDQSVIDAIQPAFLGTPDDLDYVVSESDYLSLHLHLNAETRHTIDARRIALMKPTACLINVARGALADEAALYTALEGGKIGGAGLDVFAREPPDWAAPVYKLPNVVATPHTAGVTDGTSRKRAACCAENIDRLAQGLEPLYRIDV